MQLLYKIQCVKGKREWLNGMCEVSEVTNVSSFSQLSYFIAGISQKIISRVPWPRRFGSVCSSLFVPLRLLRLSRRSEGVTRGNNELHILPEWRNKRKDVPDWWLGPRPGVRVCVRSQEMEIRVRWWVARYVIFPLLSESPPRPPFPLVVCCTVRFLF